MLRTSIWLVSADLQGSLPPGASVTCPGSLTPITYFECFSCRSLLPFLVRMLQSFSADLMNTIVPILSSTYSLTYLYIMSTLLVWLVAVTFFAINITPTLSTLTMMWSLNDIFMLCSSLMMKMTSFTAYVSATHLVSELDRVKFLCASDFHDTDTPKMYGICFTGCAMDNFEFEFQGKMQSIKHLAMKMKLQIQVGRW